MTTIVVTVQVHKDGQPDLSISARSVFTATEFKDMTIDERAAVKQAVEYLYTKVKTAWIRQGQEWN